MRKDIKHLRMSTLFIIDKYFSFLKYSFEIGIGS